MAEDEQMMDATSTSKSPEDWIRLVSDDGYSYLVKRKVAMASGTLRNMLGVESEYDLWYVKGTLSHSTFGAIGSFAESAFNTCPVNARAIVTEKLCEYMQYKQTYENAPAKEDIPDFQERIPPEVALELYVLFVHLDDLSLMADHRLVAADYYESKFVVLMGSI
ncbi:hypothetical protein EIP86_000186 [Pleurotus ostreatoroseus]|nr:hypothetical protein EIP86_000186 [Pleurotus ostreatoroseus]